ncbi:MAG: hypothetical protein J4O05_10445 [Chloroflexi bacterium]|nr:hypothetical protein [Chloroflexota bacterium]
MSLLTRVRGVLIGPSVSVAILFVSIGLFTVAFLAGESPPSQSPISAVTWSAFVSAFIAFGFVAVWLAVRRVSKALSRLVLPGYITFAFYGYFQGFVSDVVAFDFIRNRLFFSDRIFLPLAVVATLLVYFAASRFVTWNLTIARYTLVLVLALTLWNFSLWGLRQSQSYSFETERATTGVVLDRPDDLFPIYWLLFDGYARDDVLERHFGFDNSPFLDQLESRGFVVNRKAITNFMATGLVLPGQMELENLGAIDPVSARSLVADRDPAHWRFEESALARLLGDIGYRSVELSSERSTSVATRVFPISFYESTGLRALPPRLQLWRRSAGTGFIENMEATVAQSGAQDVLVFSYNYPPHPPYLFSATGPTSGPRLIQPDFKTRREEWQHKDEYVGQLEFVNSQILQAVEQIMAASPAPPLIIIQSDHGPASNWTEGKIVADPNEALFYERTSILSAVLLPSSCERSALEESNSSVNTFNLILNSCFGTQMPVHPDDVFWGNIGALTRYEDGVWSEVR